MDPRERRLTENEITFRAVNEQIEDLARGHGNDDHLYEFLCECSNTDCMLRIELTIAQYEAVRSKGARFAIATGHMLPEIEKTIESNDRYDVIEKLDDAGRLARENDPRRS